MPRLRLTDTVDASAPARPFDVRALKTALQQVGDYAPPGGAITAWSDAPMFDELKRFQRRTGLTADGIVSPGGPTETALNAALAERAQPGSRHHSVFRLGDGVGADQPNRGADVRNTKRALAWAGYYPQERAQDPEPSVDDALGFGLLGFQHDFGLTADSYLRPGGETERKLNRLIAPLIAQSGVRASPVADATGRKSPPPPVVNKEADRIRSILDDTPARFEFRPIPKADGSPTFWERPELGRQAVEKFGAIIDKMSAKHGVDPDMLRAIMWFENARGHWLGGNDLKDWLGTSGSVMPMNIKPELWGGPSSAMMPDASRIPNRTSRPPRS